MAMDRTLEIGDLRVEERRLADLCQRYRVRELLFFGSAARGEMRPDSDIDLLVEFLPGAEIDLVDFASLDFAAFHHRIHQPRRLTLFQPLAACDFSLVRSR
jgi:predicted nucleotidyltransferase